MSVYPIFSPDSVKAEVAALPFHAKNESRPASFDYPVIDPAKPKPGNGSTRARDGSRAGCGSKKVVILSLK